MENSIKLNLKESGISSRDVFKYSEEVKKIHNYLN